jgi:hypothetical protein
MAQENTHDQNLKLMPLTTDRKVCPWACLYAHHDHHFREVGTLKRKKNFRRAAKLMLVCR